jgi:hypothetical protein
MTYVLILFIVAIALAPLSHFLPSKKQRKLAGLREYAAVNGLFVEFRNLPGTTGQRADGSIIYYGKRLPASRVKAARSLAWRRDDAGWLPLERGAATPQELTLLPPEVLAASTDENSCGAYWREAGEVATVEQIRQALEAWAASLRE